MLWAWRLIIHNYEHKAIRIPTKWKQYRGAFSTPKETKQTTALSFNDDKRKALVRQAKQQTLDLRLHSDIPKVTELLSIIAAAGVHNKSTYSISRTFQSKDFCQMVQRAGMTAVVTLNNLYCQHPSVSFITLSSTWNSWSTYFTIPFVWLYTNNWSYYRWHSTYVKTYLQYEPTSLSSDVIHNLVFPFSWYISIRQNNLDVLPSNVVVHAVMDVEAKALCQVVHEICPRGDAVTVKRCRLFWWKLNAYKKQHSAKLLPT